MSDIFACIPVDYHASIPAFTIGCALTIHFQEERTDRGRS